MAAHTDEKSESCAVNDFRAKFRKCAVKVLVQQNFMNSVLLHRFCRPCYKRCQIQTISLL